MKITNPSLSLILRVRTALLATLLGLGAHAAVAQNSIESVNVSPQSGGKIVIRVGLKDALATAPAGFTVADSSLKCNRVMMRV